MMFLGTIERHAKNSNTVAIRRFIIWSESPEGVLKAYCPTQTAKGLTLLFEHICRNKKKMFRADSAKLKYFNFLSERLNTPSESHGCHRFSVGKTPRMNH